jgi:hypothetical protein|tara:strand:+ start:1122 stop:1454 length:333 start_codon:yes stop_codon:yes gene_type:complete
MKYLSLDVIKKYEKYANHYNVARVCRGLDKSTKTTDGFLVIYKKYKDPSKLRSIYATKNTTWDKYRINYIKAKLALMKKYNIPFYVDDKKTPSKMHTILIMWGYSPKMIT